MFDFEKLDVYQHSLSFQKRVRELVESLESEDPILHDQLKSSAVAVSINIAQAYAHWHNGDRYRFLVKSREYLFRCVSLLTVFCDQHLMSEQQHAKFRGSASKLVLMVTQLALQYKTF